MFFDVLAIRTLSFPQGISLPGAMVRNHHGVIMEKNVGLYYLEKELGQLGVVMGVTTKI